MIVGRIIGWIVFVAALPVLATDALVWIESGYWVPLRLGQLLYNLDRSSLSMIRAVVENLSPYAWDPVMTTALACWAFLGLMGLGTLIMTLFHERTQYQYQSLSAPTASSRSLRNRYPGSRTRWR
jgi:hypothetical protein